MDQDAIPRNEAVRIVEIGEDRRTVALRGNEIVVAGGDREIERVPVDEIAGMVAYDPGPIWAEPALAALTERCVGIVLCGPNHLSRTLCWPAPIRSWPTRIRAQLDLYPPYARHLLRQLERARNTQRVLALETMGAGRKLQALKAPQTVRGRGFAPRARQEFEAEIARHYWSWLIGRGFRRNPAGSGVNAIMNCAHTALRIEAARAVHGAGLLAGAALGAGIGHRGLIDELAIPFRPAVELAAAVFIATGATTVDTSLQDAFARLMATPLRGRRGPVQIRLGLAELARSLARCFETGETRLDLLLPTRQDPDALFALRDGSGGIA